MIDYKEIARQARIKVLELIFKAGTSHAGSNLSAIDIMAVLFEHLDLRKDKFILSAGWKAASLYYFLWKKGVITEDELNSFCQEIKCKKCLGTGVVMKEEWDAYTISKNKKMFGCYDCNNKGKIQSPFIGLSEPMGRWGLEFGGGSMGMGLPAAVGYALSKKLKGEEGKIYVLMSDGEMQCGTIWESALIAAHHKLNNLIVICDGNRYQAMGLVNKILDLKPLIQKWLNFGWKAIQLDGHNYGEIENIWNMDFSQDIWGEDVKDKPLFVLAETIKGKGVKFMEWQNLYHYKQISDDEYERAMSELNK